MEQNNNTMDQEAAQGLLANWASELRSQMIRPPPLTQGLINATMSERRVPAGLLNAVLDVNAVDLKEEAKRKANLVSMRRSYLSASPAERGKAEMRYQTLIKDMERKLMRHPTMCGGQLEQLEKCYAQYPDGNKTPKVCFIDKISIQNCRASFHLFNQDNKRCKKTFEKVKEDLFFWEFNPATEEAKRAEARLHVRDYHRCMLHHFGRFSTKAIQRD